MEVLLPYPALTMCREFTSADCQQASASWGQPEGHVTRLLLLKRSLQEPILLLPCSPSLPSSLGSHTPVRPSLQAQTFAGPAFSALIHWTWWCAPHKGHTCSAVGLVSSLKKGNLTPLLQQSLPGDNLITAMWGCLFITLVCHLQLTQWETTTLHP